MTTWPLTLPQLILRQGYQEKFADSSMRTTVDAGPDKVRRRFVGQSKEYTVAVFLTSDQVDILETFYETTTESGTIAFDFPHPRTGTTIEVRFKSPPTISPDGANFVASFMVEELP